MLGLAQVGTQCLVDENGPEKVETEIERPQSRSKPVIQVHLGLVLYVATRTLLQH